MSNTSAPVTIVVVSYNHDRYICECLDSILAQTLLPEAILVYDDQSGDNSAQIASEYVKSHKSLISAVTNKSHQGLTRTLNDALQTISTPYYAYLSADDVMNATRIATQYDRLSSLGDNYAVCYSDANLTDETGSTWEMSFCEREGTAPPITDRSGDIWSYLLNANWIPAPSVMLQTAPVRAVGGYDERLFYEDHDLWLRLASHYLFDYVDATLVNFRVLSTSLGSTRFKSENLEFIENMRMINRKQLGVRPEEDLWIKHRLGLLALRAWFAGASGRDVADELLEAPTPLAAFYSLLAKLRVNGRLISRARSLLHGLAGARARV